MMIQSSIRHGNGASGRTEGRPGPDCLTGAPLGAQSATLRGTHALIDAAFDAVARFSGHALARRMPASSDTSMLVPTDRSFPGYELWAATRATGVHLVWRIKQNSVFDPLEILPDGSFLAIMRPPADNVRYGQARAAGRRPRPADISCASSTAPSRSAPPTAHHELRCSGWSQACWTTSPPPHVNSR